MVNTETDVGYAIPYPLSYIISVYKRLVHNFSRGVANYAIMWWVAG